jgi:polyisoprenoid-binding protein YceI
VTTATSARLVETGTWALDKAHTKVGFTAKHLMITKVRGHFDDFEGTVEIADDLSMSAIEVTLGAASITTGTADRDGHLRSPDFLDVDNYPEVSFVSRKIEFDGAVWRVEGDLTIRDVTRPITLTAVYEGSAADPWGNDHIAFSASAHLRREDWGLTWNVALEGGGWLVSQDVAIEIEGQLVRP